MNKIEQYFFNIALALDRLGNADLGGSPEMTISGRMGRDIAAGKCQACNFICKIMNVFQTNHCAKTAVDEAALGSDAVSKE